MFLVDLRAKKITGKDAEAALGRAHITVNKNAIPTIREAVRHDGIRIGSPAMDDARFRGGTRQVANFIADVLEAHSDPVTLAKVGACRQRALHEISRVWPGDARDLRHFLSRSWEAG